MLRKIKTASAMGQMNKKQTGHLMGGKGIKNVDSVHEIANITTDSRQQREREAIKNVT